MNLDSFLQHFTIIEHFIKTGRCRAVEQNIPRRLLWRRILFVEIENSDWLFWRLCRFALFPLGLSRLSLPSRGSKRCLLTVLFVIWAFLSYKCHGDNALKGRTGRSFLRLYWACWNYWLSGFGFLGMWRLQIQPFRDVQVSDLNKSLLVIAASNDI